MGTCAERLVNRLYTSPHLTVIGEVGRVSESISHLDAIDPTFSATAENLLLSGDRVIAKMLVIWLDSSHRMNSADREAAIICMESGRNYTAPDYVLHEIIRTSSMERLHVAPARWNSTNSLMMSEAAYRLLAASGTTPLPTPKNTPKEIDRYFHPMAVAMRILSPVTQEQRQQFVPKAERFMGWASSQPDMNHALTSAFRVGSVDPEVVVPYMSLCESITEPLRNGAL